MRRITYFKDGVEHTTGLKSIIKTDRNEIVVMDLLRRAEDSLEKSKKIFSEVAAKLQKDINIEFIDAYIDKGTLLPCSMNTTYLFPIWAEFIYTDNNSVSNTLAFENRSFCEVDYRDVEATILHIIENFEEYMEKK